MSNNNAAQAEKVSQNPFDIFIVGCRKGWNLGVFNLIPNVLMAFVLTYMLTIFGVMDWIGNTCGGFMAVFGLPGKAILVLCATWLSCGAGVGVAAALATDGSLNAHDITILLPALILMASQIQYMGRLLGITDCPKKYPFRKNIFSNGIKLFKQLFNISDVAYRVSFKKKMSAIFNYMVQGKIIKAQISFFFRRSFRQCPP